MKLKAVSIALLLSVLAATCATSSKGKQYWNSKWGPLVPHKSFPTDCKLCHFPDGWESIRPEFSFDHAKETGHELKGAHTRAACLRCHNDFGPVAMYTARGCVGCHADIHRSSMGNDCLSCHTESSWRATGLIADHARTRFPLIGRHVATACIQCHEQAPTGMYRGAPIQCEQCHQPALAQARNPDHVAQGWTNRCDRCHTPISWGASGFSHSFFPLSGAHRAAACNACHTGGVFGPLPRDCFSCHQDDHARAPSHENFSRQCEQCHNTSTWEGARFTHTNFPLTGAHVAAQCTDCHTTGVFGPLPRDCLSCHQDDRARAPNHQDFSDQCEQCHGTTTWKGATFNHRFPIAGPHNVNCTVCHVGGNTSTFTCLVCHDHSQSKMDDKHSERAGYSYNSAACLRCHPTGRD